jgi:hypothetical protein
MQLASGGVGLRLSGGLLGLGLGDLRASDGWVSGSMLAR